MVKRKRRGGAARGAASQAEKAVKAQNSDAEKSPLELLTQVRRTLRRRKQDPNSIGVRATCRDASEAASSESPSLTGFWRFLNRSKAVPQPFTYSRISPKVGEYPGGPASGPDIWHPACTRSTGTEASHEGLVRGLTDGIGCLEEERAEQMHPAFFGRPGGSKAALKYVFSHDSEPVISADANDEMSDALNVAPSTSVQPLSEEERALCKTFEGTWKGTFTLPVKKGVVLQVKEVFQLRCGVGPGFVPKYKAKKTKGAYNAKTMANSSASVEEKPAKAKTRSSGSRRSGVVNNGGNKLVISGATGAELVASLLQGAHQRRSIPVLGRGRNEYGCFTLCGRLFLDEVHGGDEILQDTDMVNKSKIWSSSDATKMSFAAASEISSKLTAGIMKGCYLECDKLYDEALAKWRKSQKAKQALRGLLNADGASGIISDSASSTDTSYGRRSKRSRKMSLKLVTQIKQEAAMIEEARLEEEKKRLNRINMEKRRKERIEAEKKRKKLAAEKAERERLEKIEQDKIAEKKRLESEKKRKVEQEEERLRKETAKRVREEAQKKAKEQREKAHEAKKRRAEEKKKKDEYQKYKEQLGLSHTGAFSESRLSSRRLPNRWATKGRQQRTESRDLRKQTQARKKPKLPKYPVVTEYDLIPEGKLVATVYKPPLPSAAVVTAADPKSVEGSSVSGTTKPKGHASSGQDAIAENTVNKPSGDNSAVKQAQETASTKTEPKSDGKLPPQTSASSAPSNDNAPPKAPSLPALEFRVGHIDHTGETYEGEIDLGVRHGRGTCIYSNGHMYEGLWSMGKENGYGLLTDKDDNILYEGTFFEGKINGKGKYYFKGGHVYEGEWREGKRWGNGDYTSKDGSVYKGEWKDNVCEGRGYFLDKDGNSYDGDWHNNMRHGYGVMRSHTGFIYDGDWKRNVPDGRGTAVYPDKSRYDGAFKNGRREGRGRYAFANGAVYEGRFRDDSIDGMGTFKMPNAVFMPGASSPDTMTTDRNDNSPAKETNENTEGLPKQHTRKQSGDTWMVPINLSQDISTIHFLAGFDKEGL